MLVQLLGHIGGALFKTNKVKLDNLHLLKVAGYDFIHGGFIMNGCMGTVLYCEDAPKRHPRDSPPEGKNALAVRPLYRRNAAAQSCKRGREIQSMNNKRFKQFLFCFLLAGVIFSLGSPLAARAGGFERLFDGKTLNGWMLRGRRGTRLHRSGRSACVSGGWRRRSADRENASRFHFEV